MFTGKWQYTEYPAILSIEKNALPGTYYDSSEITYNIDFGQDLAGIDAENAVLKDMLPSGLSLDPSSIVITGLDSDQYQLTATSSSITLNIGSLDYGKYRITYTATANTGRHATTLINTASLSADNDRGTVRTEETVPIVGQFIAEYDFISEDGSPLPKEVMQLLPEDNTWYKEGETVNAKTPEETTVVLEEGRWDFTGYDKNSQKITNSDIKFTGTWAFTPPDIYIEKEASGGIIHTGDTIKYTVEFGQTVEKVSALDAKITDEAGAGIEIKTDTIKISGLKTSEYEISKAKTGYEITIKKLPYGNFTIEYEAKVTTDRLDSVNVENVVTMSADNVNEEPNDNAVVPITPHYAVTYDFISDDGSPLPKEVMDLQPVDKEFYDTGDIIEANTRSSATVVVEEGRWDFVGYHTDRQTIEEEDILFSGTWTFTPPKLLLNKEADPQTEIVHTGDIVKYIVTFGQSVDKVTALDVVVADKVQKGLELDSNSIAIKGLEKGQYELESSKTGYTLTIDKLPKGSYEVSYEAKVTTDRLDSVNVENIVTMSAVNVEGELTADTETPITPHYAVTYDFISDDGSELPQEVMQLLPEDRNLYDSGETVESKIPENTMVTTEEGRWDFTGYDKNSQKITNSDIKFTGTWQLTEPTLSIDKSHAEKEKDYFTGDKVSYEIKFAQNTEHAYGIDVIIADNIPEGQEILKIV